MSTETLPKPKSKTEAKAMYAEDRRAWEESYFAEAESYVNQLTYARRTAENDTDRHFMDAVALHVPKEPGLGVMDCITCADPDSLSGNVAWPCQTFTHLAQAIDLPGLAEKGEGPSLEDYWTEPYITVTLARSARVQQAGSRLPEFLHRGSQVTLTLTEAQRVQSQLMEPSRKRVEALS